jgi:hypothetical protein
MPNIEKYDDLIIGSGIAGKLTAWTALAVVELRSSSAARSRERHARPDTGVELLFVVFTRAKQRASSPCAPFGALSI